MCFSFHKKELLFKFKKAFFLICSVKELENKRELKRRRDHLIMLRNTGNDKEKERE